MGARPYSAGAQAKRPGRPEQTELPDARIDGRGDFHHPHVHVLFALGQRGVHAIDRDIQENAIGQVITIRRAQFEQESFDVGKSVIGRYVEVRAYMRLSEESISDRRKGTSEAIESGSAEILEG